MSRPDTAVVMTATSPAEAQVVAALLRAEGIATYVGGVLLQDEFAVSQRALGLEGVVIEVAADALGRARDVIARARAAGEELAGEPDA